MYPWNFELWQCTFRNRSEWFSNWEREEKEWCGSEEKFVGKVRCKKKNSVNFQKRKKLNNLAKTLNEESSKYLIRKRKKKLEELWSLRLRKIKKQSRNSCVRRIEIIFTSFFGFALSQFMIIDNLLRKRRIRRSIITTRNQSLQSSRILVRRHPNRIHKAQFLRHFDEPHSILLARISNSSLSTRRNKRLTQSNSNSSHDLKTINIKKQTMSILDSFLQKSTISNKCNDQSLYQWRIFNFLWGKIN